MNIFVRITKSTVEKKECPWDHAKKKACFQKQIQYNRSRRYCKKLHNTYRRLLPRWTTISSSHSQCSQAVIILEE